MKAITHERRAVQVFTVDGKLKGYRMARKILEEIAWNWGLTPEEVCGSKRKSLYVSCRREIATTLRNNLHLSLPDIGHVMNRHHTAVLHLLGLRGKRSGSTC